VAVPPLRRHLETKGNKMTLQKAEFRRMEQEKRSSDFAAELAKMAAGQPARAPQKWRVPIERFGKIGEMVGDVRCCKVPPGVSFKDLLEGDAWRLVHKYLTPGMFLVAWADDLSWVGFLAVIYTSDVRGIVELRQLGYFELAGSSAREERGAYEVRHAGLHEQWQIIRLADSHIMKTGIRREEDARREAGDLNVAGKIAGGA
jgi:hypothetical protein